MMSHLDMNIFRWYLTVTCSDMRKKLNDFKIRFCLKAKRVKKGFLFFIWRKKLNSTVIFYFYGKIDKQMHFTFH